MYADDLHGSHGVSDTWHDVGNVLGGANEEKDKESMALPKRRGLY